MPPAGALYLFLLGLASGLALLTASAFRKVSPAWVRWLLLACGALVISRYVAMALQTLNMLVIEQSSTGATITGRFEGELRAPLEDILREAEVLGLTAKDPETASHLARIREDVESIRSRLKNVAAGPNTLLGVDEVKCDKVDEILGLRARGLRSVTLLPLGYRDASGDWLVGQKKVRRPLDALVTRVA